MTRKLVQVFPVAVQTISLVQHMHITIVTVFQQRGVVMDKMIVLMVLMKLVVQLVDRISFVVKVANVLIKFMFAMVFHIVKISMMKRCVARVLMSFSVLVQGYVLSFFNILELKVI